jgi:FimV-like protein
VRDLRKNPSGMPMHRRPLTRTLVVLVFLGGAWAHSWAAIDSYTTQPGDTLWDLAARYSKAKMISHQHMMLALFRANPEAFSDADRNRLKTGVILRIPAREEILSTRFEDAPAVAAPPSTPVAAADRAVTGALADHEGLQSRIASLEERLVQLDEIITEQHEQLTELQQRLASSQAQAVTPTVVRREDVVAPGGETPAAMVTITPTRAERPGGTPWSPPGRIASSPVSPKIALVVGGLALLGLVGLWWWRRRPTTHRPATTAAVVTWTALPGVEEDEGTGSERQDLAVAAEVVPEDSLENLMLEVDDLDLQGTQGREEGLDERGTRPR